MIDLYLWFSENFEKRYTECQKKYGSEKMPEPFLVDRLSSERENLLLITDEAEYQHEVDKWRPLKTIVDAIYKELSPFTEQNQSVKLDLSKLSISDNMASPILLSLIYERVCRWRITSPGIISNVPVMEYLSGEGIIVPSYEKFKKFRNEVNDFFNYLMYHQKQKFFEALMTTMTTIDSPNLKMHRVAQDSALERALVEGYKEEALTGRILTNVEKGLQSVNRDTPMLLNNYPIEFIDEKAILRWNNKDCEMPPYKNEHYFCRVMYNSQHPIKVAVDWSIIFEEMEEFPDKSKGRDDSKDMRSIQDTMYALNKRVKDVFNTQDSLFSWKNKSVVRNY